MSMRTEVEYVNDVSKINSQIKEREKNGWYLRGTPTAYYRYYHDIYETYFLLTFEKSDNGTSNVQSPNASSVQNPNASVAQNPNASSVQNTGAAYDDGKVKLGKD